tara:strand:- start:2562 stop:4130 length:1569 start_codon:yes stop_codon:yes gene_type:complete
MKFYKYLFLLIITNQFFSNTVVTGDASFYYMNRLSDNSLVNIPFRMLNLNILHQNNNFDVKGNIALEYRNRKDTDFMESSDPIDINTVLRELYLTYYLNKGEISVGKKIYTWGNVDENSPIDILNAYDNYYLLLGPTERKLGSYSISFDYYINEGTTKFSAVYAPMHNATRYPLNDDEYEFGLPVTILPNQILEIDKPGEIGLSIQQTFNIGDISYSYFRGYNRAPSLSGFNEYVLAEYEDGDWDVDTNPVIDLVYNYHLTEASNLGGVLLFNDFTFRFDHTEFKTKDDNGIDEYSERSCGTIGIGYGYSCNKHNLQSSPSEYKYVVNGTSSTSDFDETIGEFTGNYHSYPLYQKAEYSQQTFQIEIPLTNSYQINMQYFKYKLNSYDYIDPLDSETEIRLPNIELPDECVDESTNTLVIDGCLSFNPSLGAPFALLSSETFFISLEKTILDDDLKLTLSSLMDIDKGFGELISFEADYDIGNGLKTIIGLTKILGDKEQDNYTFNDLEDFSNIRFEIKYNF